MQGAARKNEIKDAKKREAERVRAATPGESPAKKQTVQDSKSSSPSSAPPEVEPAPLQPAVVVAKAAPPATQKQAEKKAVNFGYGYPIVQRRNFLMMMMRAQFGEKNRRWLRSQNSTNPTTCN